MTTIIAISPAEPAQRRRCESAGQEGEEGGQELLGHLEMGDVPTVRHHYPGGPRYIASGRRRELQKVTQPGDFLWRGALAEGYPWSSAPTITSVGGAIR
jgi:hypothetical protein